MTDEEVAEHVSLCRSIDVTVHIRGTDKHPVIEFKDRLFRQVVGGIEIKRRLMAAEQRTKKSSKGRKS